MGISSTASGGNIDVIFGHEFGPYGPWEDPRSAKSGGCGGAIPDIVWAENSEQLDDAVGVAVAHATLGSGFEDDGTMHVLEDPAWVTVEPDYAKSRVIVSSRLLDVDVTRDLARPLARLNGMDTPYKFAVQSSGRLTATAEVAAHPFVPLHLGQVILDLIEFTFEFMVSDVRVDLPGTDCFSSFGESGIFFPWCGTGQIEYEERYESVAAHPRWVWRPAGEYDSMDDA